MESFHVYQDIQARTGGEIYIGVVGPVRTGKSTFIKRFMDLLVLPGIEDIHSREQAKDELPQSAAGRTIMTTEPKFIPKEAAKISVGEGLQVSVRLIDCVGFMVEGAVGHEEDNEERMVKTPWSNQEIPFTKAAEIGTRKVITDHSTIGIAVTTDGSISEIPRESYVAAEEQTVQELKQIGKPFILLLNCVKPYAPETRQLASELEEKYGVHVLPVNCEQLRSDDLLQIMGMVLEEFPVTELDFDIPKWVEILPSGHWLKSHIIELAKNMLSQVTSMKDLKEDLEYPESPHVRRMKIEKKNLADGKVSVTVQVEGSYYYKIISEYTGIPITGEYQLMKTLLSMAGQRQEYEKVRSAMDSVRQRGYGVVTPEREEIMLNEPEIIRHGNKFGVKMKAQAPSIHLIQAYIETEIAPIVGTEEQARDLIDYINGTARESREGIWETNIFGKSIEQIVDDGIHTKINQMTDSCQQKLQEALKKIINDSNGGVICIII